MADGPALDTPSEDASDEDPTSEASASPLALLRDASTADLLWLAALAVAFGAAFAPQFAWMWERWMKSEYYGHGLFIPPVAAYLIYRRREALAELVSRQDSLGLMVIVAGLVAHLMAVQLDVHFASIFASIAVIWGLTAWLWGRPVALAALFPIGYLCFMVPIDRLLIDAFASPLQLLAANMSAGFAEVIGIPVTSEGVNVGVPGYTFEVAIPCGGLKSLIAMTALATLYAYGMKASLWQRLTIIAAAVPLAILGNAARVTTILLVAQSMGARAAEGFFHGLSGVVVFTVGLLGLYGIGRLLGCRELRDDI